MAVTEQRIRGGLPNRAPGVLKPDIDASISGWQARIEAEGGPGASATPLGDMIWYYGALADARLLHDTAEGEDESPLSVALGKQTDAFLKTLKAEKAERERKAEEDARAAEDDGVPLVSNFTRKPLWSESPVGSYRSHPDSA